MCLFCDIAAKKIPSYEIYEDDSCFAFLDISQATMGHTLIVPKKHYENFLDLPSEEASHIAEVAKIVSKKLQDKLGFTALNLINNSGKIAEQSVMHFHLHIIPRYEGDGISYQTTPHKLTKEELDTIYNKIIN